MKKLLVIGDAACDSGFANVTHSLLSYLYHVYDTHVLGVNYRGDPHDYPYKIYPAYVAGCRNFIGTERLPQMLDEIKPDLILLQTDPWHVPSYDALINCKIPTVGIIAVDGKNCAGHLLNTLDRVIFWTHFGKTEAIRGGFTKPSVVIPLGVDLDIFSPGNKRDSRIAAGLPLNILDAFIVGNVNRNQPRKRFDLLIKYFCTWVTTRNIQDAYLFLHVGPTGEVGYDCANLMKYYGVKKRLLLSSPGVWKGIPQNELADIYRSFDVQVTTTQGEGWGLTTMEGMACGIPQIIPAWSALGEWTEDAVWKINCSATVATVGKVNPIGGIPDQLPFIEAMDRLYHAPSYQKAYADKGLQLVSRENFRWWKIAAAVEAELAIAYSTEEPSLPVEQAAGGTDA